MFQYKGHYQIDDKRRSDRKKRGVDEEEANVSGLYSEFFSPPGTDSESLSFEKIFDELYEVRQGVVRILFPMAQVRHFF